MNSMAGYNVTGPPVLPQIIPNLNAPPLPQAPDGGNNPNLQPYRWQSAGCYEQIFARHPKVWMGIAIILLLIIISILAYIIDKTEGCEPGGPTSYQIDAPPNIIPTWRGDDKTRDNRAQ